MRHHPVIVASGLLQPQSELTAKPRVEAHVLRTNGWRIGGSRATRQVQERPSLSLQVLAQQEDGIPLVARLLASAAKNEPHDQTLQRPPMSSLLVSSAPKLVPQAHKKSGITKFADRTERLGNAPALQRTHKKARLLRFKVRVRESKSIAKRES